MFRFIKYDILATRGDVLGLVNHAHKHQMLSLEASQG